MRVFIYSLLITLVIFLESVQSSPSWLFGRFGSGSSSSEERPPEQTRIIYRDGAYYRDDGRQIGIIFPENGRLRVVGTANQPQREPEPEGPVDLSNGDEVRDKNGQYVGKIYEKEIWSLADGRGIHKPPVNGYKLLHRGKQIGVYENGWQHFLHQLLPESDEE